MTLNVRMQSSNNRLKPRITVVGVGGAGGNAVNNMISSGLEGCEFLVCNTDAQALEGSRAAHKIQLGVNVTRGLGAGANPEIGSAAADESIEDILAYLDGSNMVFVTAGMGGGTGTGAAPVIAQAAREAGILTVGVVTKPFHFEGTHRMRLAENGIAELQKYVDTLIIIPNQNLFRIANEKTTFSDAFRMADEVLQSGVRGVTDLMVMPGLINLDFADIRAVMAEMGKAMMGTGEAEGERRAVEAAEAAISNPLLDDVSMKGARGVLINITGGLDMTLFEVDEAANRIRDEVDPDANIIFGSTFDQALQGKMRVSVVATGIEANAMAQPRPLQLAGSQVEPARRSTVGGAAQRPAVQQPSYGQPGNQGYTGQGFANQGFASQGGYGRGEGFASGSSAVTPNLSVPAGIVPGGRPSFQPTAKAAQQTVAAATADAGASWNEPTVGHAAGVQTAPVSATATARKLQESELTTKPAAPVTQSYQRPIPPAGQPRGQRHGDSFIPPKPVDPKHMTHAGADLFGEPAMAPAATAPVAAPAKKAAAPQAPVAPAEKAAPKKSPSLFERFTLRREEPAVAPPAKAELSSRLTVEEGGKKDEDELDIPAFLRRQAN